MACEFFYLVAVIDQLTQRHSLGGSPIRCQRNSASMPRRRPLGGISRPETFGTNQGAHFINITPIETLRVYQVLIRMDGRGRQRDSAFVDRPWRSLKYEEVCLRAYNTASAARSDSARYVDFCNTRRPVTALN